MDKSPTTHHNQSLLLPWGLRLTEASLLKPKKETHNLVETMADKLSMYVKRHR